MFMGISELVIILQQQESRKTWIPSERKKNKTEKSKRQKGPSVPYRAKQPVLEAPEAATWQEMAAFEGIVDLLCIKYIQIPSKKMFQCFLKVMRINTLTMLKVKNLSFSGLENLQKTASCMIFIASLETARFRLKKLQLRAKSDESWSDDPVLPSKKPVPRYGNYKIVWCKIWRSILKIHQKQLEPQKKRGPLLSFKSCLVSRNPYFVVYFKNPPT